MTDAKQPPKNISAPAYRVRRRTGKAKNGAETLRARNVKVSLAPVKFAAKDETQ